jgi:hypothetical protein
MKTRSFLLLIVPLLPLLGCGYELVKGPGISVRNTPSVATSGGGTPVKITSLNLPVFKNTSFEPQVPMIFTEAFSQELAASGLVQINRSASDATLQGTVTSVSTVPSALSSQGLATQKTVTVFMSLTLAQQGNVVKSWTFSDAEPYDVSVINSEDYNKRAALSRIAERIAHRFHALIIAGP